MQIFTCLFACCEILGSEMPVLTVWPILGGGNAPSVGFGSEFAPPRVIGCLAFCVLVSATKLHVCAL